MTKIIRHISRGVLSVVTTFVLMAAPIAAVVYSSDSTLNQAEYSSAPVKYSDSWQIPTNGEYREWVMAQEPAGGQTIAMAKKIEN